LDNLAKDAIVASFGAAVALAGLILIFVGFVFTRAESMNTVALTKKYKNVARSGFIPLTPLLISAWLCLNYLDGDPTTYRLAVLALRTGLITTVGYAFVVLFIYL
jgi:hypothetical protein